MSNDDHDGMNGINPRARLKPVISIGVIYINDALASSSIFISFGGVIFTRILRDDNFLFD